MRWRKIAALLAFGWLVFRVAVPCDTTLCCGTEYLGRIQDCIKAAPGMPQAPAPEAPQHEKDVYLHQLAERKLFLQYCFDASLALLMAEEERLPNGPKPILALNGGRVLAIMELPPSPGTLFSDTIDLPENQRGNWTLYLFNGLAGDPRDSLPRMRVRGTVRVNGTKVFPEENFNGSFSQGGIPINLDQATNNITIQISQDDAAQFGFLAAYIKKNQPHPFFDW